MGVCFSANKVSGSNSNTNTNTNTAAAKRRASTASTQWSTTVTKQDPSRNQNLKRPNNQPLKIQEKNALRRKSGAIPCGKRTDFGYHKDFDERYTIGKLLGHGQFGYTYVAIDKANGDRVAVKKIEKKKVLLRRIWR